MNVGNANYGIASDPSEFFYVVDVHTLEQGPFGHLYTYRQELSLINWIGVGLCICIGITEVCKDFESLFFDRFIFWITFFNDVEVDIGGFCEIDC